MTAQSLNTKGIILKRTNYGEADRILNIITPQGKIAAIAKSARKEHSKLAGGIEMFSLTDLTIHQGKGSLSVITSARMIKHYSGIIKNLDKIEFAATVLKKVSAASEHTESPDFFEITKQVLEELDSKNDFRLIESWFWLNLKKLSGEEVNLYRDVTSQKLTPDHLYEWDPIEGAFIPHAAGTYGANEIKMLRVLSDSNFNLAKRVKTDDNLIEKISIYIKTIKTP